MVSIVTAHGQGLVKPTLLSVLCLIKSAFAEQLILILWKFFSPINICVSLPPTTPSVSLNEQNGVCGYIYHSDQTQSDHTLT